MSTYDWLEINGQGFTLVHELGGPFDKHSDDLFALSPPFQIPSMPFSRLSKDCSHYEGGGREIPWNSEKQKGKRRAERTWNSIPGPVSPSLWPPPSEISTVLGGKKDDWEIGKVWGWSFDPLRLANSRHSTTFIVFASNLSSAPCSGDFNVCFLLVLLFLLFFGNQSHLGALTARFKEVTVVYLEEQLSLRVRKSRSDRMSFVYTLMFTDH